MLKPNSNKSMADALEQWFGSFSESFNCIKIGKIISVDYEHQTVNVEIMHKRTIEQPAKNVLRAYPQLQNVPFISLRGGASYLTLPVTAGDSCVLLFCDYEIDKWVNTGTNQPATYQRKHDISDAIALTGINSLTDLIKGYSQYVKLQYNDNSNIVVGDEISINNETTNVSGKLNVKSDITGDTKCTSELHSTNGATGTFTNYNGNTLTIEDGIITKIS